MQWHSTSVLFPDVTFFFLKVRDTEHCTKNLPLVLVTLQETSLKVTQL